MAIPLNLFCRANMITAGPNTYWDFKYYIANEEINQYLTEPVYEQFDDFTAFTDPKDGINYYEGAAMSATVDLMNSYFPDRYEAGALQDFDERTQGAFNAKQALDSALTSLASLSMSNGQFIMASGPKSLINKTASQAKTALAITASDVSGFSTVATTGAYGDLSGKPTIPTRTSDLTNDSGFAVATSPTFNFPSRSLNSAFQISTTKNANVFYTVNVTCSMSLTSGQSGTVVLEYADDNAFTTNVKTVANPTASNSGALTVGLSLTQINGLVVSGMIPAAKYVRIRTVNNTGTPSYSLATSQEFLF